MFKNHAELEASLFHCKQCALAQDPNHGPTSYNGTPEGLLAIVGEGPGRVEDEYGVPLVGPSGQLLDKALASVGVTRNFAYTTNISVALRATARQLLKRGDSVRIFG